MKETNMENKNTIVFDNAPSMRTFDINGFMHVKLTPISKATVNPYLGREIPGWETMNLKPDEIYYGLRDPDELKKAAATFNGLPVLLNHHEESADAPQKEWRVGSTGTDAVFEDGYLKNSLSITDKKAIDKIEDGEMKEISCAYFFRPEWTSGEWQGMPFDFIMRDIKGNHVALVAEGRAGHDVAVADSKVNIGGKKDTMRKKIAKDANPAIEAAEVALANFSKCVNAVEAIAEGIDPAAVGLAEIAPDATIETIVDTFMPDLDEETRAKKIAKLEAMAAAGAADSECGEDDETDVPVSIDEEPETVPAPESADDDEGGLEEKMKDPAFREGFEMGTRYGEKREKEDPDRIDRDHEHEGEERYLDKMSADTIANVKAAARDEVMRHVRGLTRAAKECRVYIGDADPLAFDSAADIYGTALRTAGFDISKFPKSAYRAMFAVMKRERASAPVMSRRPAYTGDGLSKELKDLIYR